MTVAQLIQQLSLMNPDAMVVQRVGDMGYNEVMKVSPDTVTLYVHGVKPMYMGPHEVNYYQCGDDNFQTAPCVVLG